MRIESYSDSLALLRGLGTLRQSGLTARGMLFLALSAQGQRMFFYLLTCPENTSLTESPCSSWMMAMSSIASSGLTTCL